MRRLPDSGGCPKFDPLSHAKRSLKARSAVAARQTGHLREPQLRVGQMRGRLGRPAPRRLSVEPAQSQARAVALAVDPLAGLLAERLRALPAGSPAAPGVAEQGAGWLAWSSQPASGGGATRPIEACPRRGFSTRRTTPRRETLPTGRARDSASFSGCGFRKYFRIRRQAPPSPVVSKCSTLNYRYGLRWFEIVAVVPSNFVKWIVNGSL